MKAVSLALLALASAQKCKCEVNADLFTAYGSSDAVFWGTVGANGKATIATLLKGCALVDDDVVAVVETKGCEVVLDRDQPSLIMGDLISTKTGGVTVSACWSAVVPDVHPAEARWLTSQSISCGKGKSSKSICPDGSKPFTCKPSLCKAFKSKCGAAAKCVINKCGGCSASFLDKAGSPVCTGNDTCGDGSRPMQCKNDPCRGLRSNDLKAVCDDWESAVSCVADTCGGCFPVWVDKMGREVCREVGLHNQCRKLVNYNFGKGKKCKAKLGFGVMKNGCVSVTGCKTVSQEQPLFSSAAECTAACHCMDLSNVDFGDCSQSLGHGRIGNKCVQIRGCKAQASSMEHVLWKTRAQCNTACDDGAMSGGQRESRDDCPEGVALFECPHDPCRSPEPTCLEAKGKALMCLPDFCGGCNAIWHEVGSGDKFSCPEEQICDRTAADCCRTGLRPIDCTKGSHAACEVSDCSGAVTCQLDACNLCAPRYFDSNGREIPRTLCEGGGAGREACTSEQRGECCSDGFKPMQCADSVVEYVCDKVVCKADDGRTLPVTCGVDPCDNCNVQFTGTDGGRVPVEQCKLKPDPVECPVTCPDMEPDCGKRPKDCPSALKLKCIMDPCVCLSLWVDEDVGLPPICTADYVPPCIASDKCPSKFTCDPLPDHVVVLDVVREHLQCVQEECTCRPVLELACIPAKRCPKKFECGTPDFSLYQRFPKDYVDNFECVQEECTCRPILVPPEQLQMSECAEECPADYDCDELYRGMAKRLDPKLVEQFICGQNKCTCEPILSRPCLPCETAPPGACDNMYEQMLGVASVEVVSQLECVTIQEPDCMCRTMLVPPADKGKGKGNGNKG